MPHDLPKIIHSTTKAYSLLEMLFVIALLMVFLSLAIPFWRLLTNNNAATLAGHKIVAILEYTRILAIKQTKKISLCRRSNAQDGRDWSTGQIIRNEETGAFLRSFEALPTNVKLVWNSSFAKADCITFTATGTPDGQQGSFYYCVHAVKPSALKIIVQTTGHVHTKIATEQEIEVNCRF